MRFVILIGLVALSFGAGCSDKDPANFSSVSWQGNYTIEGGNIWFDGSGEATFLATLDCGEHVYAWYSTDEGAQGSLVARIRDGDGVRVMQEEFVEENREHHLMGAAGEWSIQIVSSPDFDGNGIAYLECEPALQSL